MKCHLPCAVKQAWLLLAAAVSLAGGSAACAQASAPTASLPTGDAAAFVDQVADGTIGSEDRMELSVDYHGPAGSLSSAISSPAAGARISSGFGWRSDPMGQGVRMHSGIDLPCAIGTPVHPSIPGVVRTAGWTGGYGYLVEIDHGGGVSTRYAHLSRILVGVGEQVGVGQTIGLVGSTGRSTGSHLHYEVRIAGRAVNPAHPPIGLAGGDRAPIGAYLPPDTLVRQQSTGWTDPNSTGLLPVAVIH